MYKLALILKYLRKRRIAWVSLIAVMLCTAMVIVVISVMGGWLEMFRASFRGLSSDVIVDTGGSLAGFPYYQEMIDEIKKLPEVEAAEPVIKSGAFFAAKSYRKFVEVIGYPIESIGKVNTFPQSLNERKDKPSFALRSDVAYENLVTQAVRESARNRPGMIIGSMAIATIDRDDDRKLHVPDFLYGLPAKLLLAGVSNGGSGGMDASDIASMPVWIVDVSRTGNYEYDFNCVYVPFDALQKNLKMNAFEGEPARASEIQVKARPGVSLGVLRDKVEDAVYKVRAEKNISPDFRMQVETWEDSRAYFIRAVEKEKLMMTFLFGLISVVAVFLIFCIFYMIVVEKTRDIGIIKSVGATSTGVAGIFLGYGLAIGLVGAGFGFAAGYAIVHYINEIHSWLAHRFGISMWDAKTYAFDTIPNTVNPREVAIILSVAVVASVLGAVVPAIRAARMHPVEALRWE